MSAHVQAMKNTTSMYHSSAILQHFAGKKLDRKCVLQTEDTLRIELSFEIETALFKPLALSSNMCSVLIGC